MGFFSKILGRDDWKQTLIRDLTMLTAVDGDMDKEEVAYVMQVAVEELGFSEQKFIKLMQNLGDVKDIYPSDHKDKLDFLEYLLKMTYVDGYVDDNEVAYMKVVAERMDLPISAIDKAIAYVESTAKGVSSGSEEDNDALNSNKVILTSIHNTVPEVQSEEGVRQYLFKVSKLTHSDLCIELSNVLAAKHNLMMMPSGINEAREKQEKVTDLTDKAVLICFNEFGQEVILNYGNRDIRNFNELVNNIDEEVAQEELYPEQHGSQVLKKLSKAIRN